MTWYIPARDSDMSVVLFVICYLRVLAEESEDTKAHMRQHLQELMEDSKRYGWRHVRDYHAAWLQHLEQGQTAWGEDHKKVKVKVKVKV